MIGDRLDTDIKVGVDFGIDTLLVFSGCTDEERFASWAKNNKKEDHPTYCAERIKFLSNKEKKVKK